MGTGVVGEKLAKIKFTQSTAPSPDHAAITGGCLCGSNDVDVAQTKFCGIKTDGTGLQMDSVACDATQSTGKAAAGAACNCGTNAAVPITATEFCEVKTGVVGTKLAKIKCTASDAAGNGVVSPTGGCLCGSNDVDVAATKWCGIKTDGTGLQMDTITCASADTTGKATQTAACNCGTNALVPVTAAEFCEVKTGVV